ncbi:MAG: hypothetical protein WCD47_14920 [Candidatus Sulfotelmatobacter sp.]
MKITRRDLLVWSAGAAAGLVVTPVPWKLLGDASIWTQNFPWIPQPTRAPVEVKDSFCTLCPNGCGMRVRMAGGWPVGLAGRSHPISRGALCPLGFAAHQMIWHPQRLQTVRHRGRASSWNEAHSAFGRACTEGPVVIVDGYPGRAASTLFASFVEKRDGMYRVVAGAETQALMPYETWSGVPAAALGYDLENVKTIVSFAAPLLDGWGNPGGLPRLWAERAAGAADPDLRLIQIEPSLSRTAARAWRWSAIHPSGEAALAAGIARVLLEEQLVGARGPMPLLTLAESAEQSGLSTDAIRDLARLIVVRPPVVAIANDDNPAVAALNVVLGAVGTRGGILLKAKHAKSYVSAEPLIPSARAVLIDSTVPWDFVPETNAEVFRFAAWDGGSSTADWLLPAPGFLEELTDVPTAPTSVVETYAIAPSLVKASPELQSSSQFLGLADPNLVKVEGVIHSRCADLFRQRAGTLRGREETPIAKIASAQKLEEQLRSGAVWIGEPQHQDRLRCKLSQWPADETSARRPLNSWATWRTPVLPPLASKLYQESNLREPAERRNL